MKLIPVIKDILVFVLTTLVGYIVLVAIFGMGLLALHIATAISNDLWKALFK